MYIFSPYATSILKFLFIQTDKIGHKLKLFRVLAIPTLSEYEYFDSTISKDAFFDTSGPKFVSTVNHPKSIEIPQTAPLRLECDAIGDPKPNISWFRNGKALVLTSGMIISNYTLTLNDLLPRHSGNYTCEVKNKWGSIHHTFNVKIKGKKYY